MSSEPFFHEKYSVTFGDDIYCCLYDSDVKAYKNHLISKACFRSILRRLRYDKTGTAPARFMIHRKTAFPGRLPPERDDKNGMTAGTLHVAGRAEAFVPRPKAFYHLPGLFEFYELYRRFLPLFFGHREYFYDWCEIGSLYGAPADCLWGGGRVGFGEDDPKEFAALLREFGISARLTFSNSLLREEHLGDKKCNALCSLFEKSGAVQNGIILSSDRLLSYIRENYPGFYFVSSTTKVLTEFHALAAELERPDFRYVVPDFRLNKALDRLDALPDASKRKVELLCNECCWFACAERRACYENVSRKNLGESCADHVCASPTAGRGYRFSDAMENPGFIGIGDIQTVYLPRGFSHFKLEGRGLGSAVVLEFLLYYMTKPEYQLKVREKIYLDSSLDLF